MNKHKLYVGIDIHHKKHKVAILPANEVEFLQHNWKKIPFLNICNCRRDFDHLDETLKTYIQSPSEAMVAVDLTGRHYSEPITAYLQNKGYEVYFLDTKGYKAARKNVLSEENKTDAIDSAGTAYMLYLREMHGLSFGLSMIGSLEMDSRAMTLRGLNLERQEFVKLETQCVNRLHQFLSAVFPEAENNYFKQLFRVAEHYPTPDDILTGDELTDIKYIRKEAKNSIISLAARTVGVPGNLYRRHILHLYQQYRDAVKKIETLDKLIETEVRVHPYGDILLSFPGFGSITASTVIEVVKDICLWPDDRKLKKAFGIYSTLGESGETAPKGKPGRSGNRSTKHMLYLVILHCLIGRSPENDFRDYCLRQVKRGKPKMKAIVATMGKLTEIIFHCLKTGELYQNTGRYR